MWPVWGTYQSDLNEQPRPRQTPKIISETRSNRSPPQKKEFPPFCPHESEKIKYRVIFDSPTEVLFSLNFPPKNYFLFFLAGSSPLFFFKLKLLQITRKSTVACLELEKNSPKFYYYFDFKGEKKIEFWFVNFFHFAQKFLYLVSIKFIKEFL